MNGSRQVPTIAANPNASSLAAAGDHRKGRFQCVRCSYATTVCRELPECPRCGGEQWKSVSWRPFARARATSSST
jgi:hypothetical protein